jgi:polysulfide reductase chain C
MGEGAQHFVEAPHWMWYIVFYFFLAGISGGSYAIATLLRLRGGPRDEPAARVGYYLAFPPLLICPILLTLDLGQPLRFWHMVISTTPGTGPFMFKPWAPMSLGVYGLIIFTAFAAVAFAQALVLDGKWRHRLAVRGAALLEGRNGRVFHGIGAVFALFIAGYTGVLLSVTNQPVWSNTWTLGGLFLASGLSISAALILFFSYYRSDAKPSAGLLTVFERLSGGLELVLIVAFAFTVAAAGTAGIVFGGWWALAWVVVLAGLAPAVAALFTRGVTPPREPHWHDLRPEPVPLDHEEPEQGSGEDAREVEAATTDTGSATKAPAPNGEGDEGSVATVDTAAPPATRRAPLRAWLPPASVVFYPALVVVSVFMLRVAVIISIH